MGTDGVDRLPRWTNWREIPKVLDRRQAKRSALIAATVGTLFFVMNQLGPIVDGRADAIVWLKAALTFLTPLVVSSVAVLSAAHVAPDSDSRRVVTPQRTSRRKMLRRKVAMGLGAVLVVGLASPAQGDDTSLAGIYRFADGSPVPGAWSSLRLTPAGASMSLQTSELPPRHTVTIWWVIFNEPANCTHPEGILRCGPGDLPIFGADDSAVTSVVYAAGHQIGGRGQASFAGQLATGDTTGALWGPGLASTNADVHLVAHDHGILPPQERAEGIHNFGPCDPECVDLQFSPHEQ